MTGRIARLAIPGGLGALLLLAACGGEAPAGDRNPEAAPEAAPPAAPVSQAARLATAVFDVEGMTCGGCVLSTEMALKKLPGVRAAEAELGEGEAPGWARVEYDPTRVTPERLQAAIEEVGFEPTLREVVTEG